MFGFFLCWKNRRPYANIWSLACLSIWILICIWVFLTSKWYSKISVYWQEQQAIHIFQFNLLKKKVSRNMRQKCVCLFVSFLVEWEKNTLIGAAENWHYQSCSFVGLVDTAFHESSSEMHVAIFAIFGTYHLYSCCRSFVSFMVS